MKRVTAFALLAFALSLCLAGLTGCVNPAWSPTGSTISSFTANPTAITAGGTASLTGVFTNGTGVITPGNLPATSGTAVSVTPSQTTTYILTVTNASGGTTAQTATVTVSATAPTIASFAASPASIAAGGTASLTGVFANGTGVITPGNLPAASGTAVSVTPTDTTTYTLTVTNSAGATITQTATVTVNPVVVTAPTITSFAATPTSIAVGGTASLTGVFANGTGVITPGNIAATSGTPVSVTPTDTTTYTLTVTNSAGVTTQQTATVAVNPVVVAAPTIASFTANPTSITAGGTSSLTGVFANGTGVITPGNIAAASGTAVSVTPSDTTTYTLTVTNSAGVIVQQTATVTVNAPAPTITSFAANPTTITAGGTASLTGVFASGTGVITPGNLAAKSGTAVSVSPANTTTYTLTVTNAAGVTTTQTATVTVNAVAPTITSFAANPTSITAGGTANLTGVFAGGTGVITPGNLTATSGTAISVSPADTTIYTLTVTNSAGATTAQTAIVTVLTAQAITFANFGAQTVGTPLTLVATATSGLTVSFASTTSSVCTVSGTTAAFIAAGTCTIDATQAGNSTYAAATMVPQSFTVNGEAQTITFANPGAQTVGTPLTLAAMATSGLTVSFASTTATVCTVSGTAAAFLTAGTCTIDATQAGNSTYAAATMVPQSFTVNATIPAAPTNLTATAGNASVTLSWTASTGATSYDVYRGATSGGESATPIATGITTTGYPDTGLTNGQPYYYEVAAVNSVGTSPMSNEASATPTASACVVTLVATDTGVAEIDLSWNPCPGATSYNILRSTTSGGPYTTLTVSTGTAYQDFGLISMQEYYYVVQAVSSAGLPVESNEANAVFTSAHVSQDANGWTTVTPSSDSKQYYVSSSTGNDTTGNGSQAKPYASITKAVNLVRPGYPDWILLKAGDIWHDDFGNNEAIGGRSADEPMVFASYGTGPRPQIRPTASDGTCFTHFSGRTFSHFYFIGLECYDSRKDPSSPDYESSGGLATASDASGFNVVDNGDDILVEDSYFHFFALGIGVQYDTGPAAKNFRIRRNVITDQYAASGAHSQGALLGNITNLLVEDNLFDHNAWNDQAGIGAGVFNHHMYIVDSYMATIRNNLMLRDESLSLKLCSYAGKNDAFAGALVYNNLIFEGEVGISMGYGSTTVLTGSAFTGFKVDNNVLLQVDRDNPTGRGLGWGIDIENVAESYFTNNIFSQFDTLGGGNTYAFNMDFGGVVASGITVQDNLIYQDAGEAFALVAGPTSTNIKIQNNTIQNNGLPAQSNPIYDPMMYRVDSGPGITGYSFSGNTYYNPGAYNGQDSTKGFAWVGVPGSDYTDESYSQWLTLTGETGSQFKQITYPDPNRTLESYDASLGGASSFNPILAAVRSQSRASWNPAYTAEAVNDYIRNGFSVASLNGEVPNSVAPPAPVTTLSATPGNNSVTFNWTAPGGSPTFYIVYRGSTAGGENVVSPVATYVTGSPWTDATAVNGTIYYYQVASMNAGGFGGLSNEVSAEPTVNAGLTAQTITFNQPAAQTVATPLTLSATATSSLAVSFASTTTGVCTVSGTTATFLAAGTCSITASQAGNSTYAAATPVSQTFAVSGTIPPAPTGLTATAGNASVTLSRTASTGATSYNIYRGTTSGGESATPVATGITTTGYTDTGLTNGQPYYYEVAAVNDAGTSPMSNEASATPSGSAVTPTTPVPPAVYVMPGRTYDPNEPLSPPTGSGTQYYVALTGNDNNPGTAALPFRTVQRGFNALTNGGDTLIIHGGLYRERVSEISKDAPDGNPFIIRPFGDGEVIVDGSTLVTGWTAQGGNIYMAHTGFDVTAVVVDNQPLYKELSVAGLQAAPTVADVPSDYRYYYDSVAQNLYVRVAGGDPGTHDTGVISTDNTQDGIYLWESNNYVLYGLSERFAGGRGINFQGSNNITVEWSKVVFNGYHGLVVGAEERDGSNAQFIKNFVYFNFMQNWPRSWVWGGWGGGVSFQSTPTGLADGNISMLNGGEGILNFDNTTGGTVFRNNVSADNWSCDYYMDNAPNGLMEGNLAVGHAPDPANWYNSGILPSDPSGDYFKVVELSRPGAFCTGDEDYGIGANLNNTTIRNNVVINARSGASYGAEGDSVAKGGLKNFRFVGNTILVPTMSSLEAGQGTSIGGINIPYNNGNNTGAYYRNNIIMGGNTGTYAMAGGAFDTQTVPAGNLFLGLTIDHNLIYAPSNTTPFIWNGGNWGTAYTHAQWLALAGGPGHGAGDVLTDPDLMNPNTDGALDKIPLPGSPAIDAGASIPAFVTSDFLGVSRPQGAGYDIGAFEVAAGQSAPTGLTATAGNASVALSWTASTGAATYNVYRGTTAGSESSTAIATGITVTAYSDTGLTNGTPYYYKVAAVNSDGTSPMSNEASATPMTAQTITFNQPAAQTVGTPLTLVATASSGLTVSFASTTSSVCTVSGATATFLTAGTCSITASQTGNSTYAAAMPVSQSFTVNAAPPVLITSISIPATATVSVGSNTTITATVLPANATNTTLTWNSSDTTTAMVSAAGVVTGIKPGTITVTAAATDGSAVVSNDCAVTVTPATSVQSNYFGINIGTDLDWDNNRMFADAMKSSRAWGTSSNAGGALPTSALDANGWPEQDASLYVWAGIDRMQGTYALSFNGQATVKPSSGSIANQVYNASMNLTTATLTYAASDSDYLTLTFTNTKRTSSSSTNTGVTNVVLMRPSAVGSTTPLASTQVFNLPFLAALSDFAVLRTMDFSATNGNEIVHWSDRTRPGDASQAMGNPGVPAGGWEGPGGAWEYAILLANQTNKDLWINVPLNADDDYITKLAQLTKYGSDGITPYTSAQTNPVWPGLNSNLHLYVEFCNEVWNTAGAFQGNENHTEAVAEVNAGGSSLNFDGEINDWYWAWRRPAEKTVQISTIFRSVWGDAAMMTTVRPVLESQLGYPDGPLLQEMHLMVDYYDNPAQMSSPHPPSYYIYGLGGSAYYNPTDLSSVNSIFSTMGTGFVSAVQNDVDYALPFGVHRIAYEGGPSLDSTGNSTEDANQAAAWADPRMEQVIVTEQNAWSQANGDLLVYFYLAGDYQWGFMSDVLSPSAPKMSGITDILASPRSASTYGTPIPATLSASSANVPPGWLWSDSSNTQMHDNKWSGFSVRVSTEEAFTVSLTAFSATSGAQAEILIDGDSIGTVTVPNSGSSAALPTPTLSVGSHGILVRNLSGTFNLTKVSVQTAP